MSVKQRAQAIAIACIAMITVSATPALAAGIASEGKSLGTQTDTQCMAKVNKILSDEKGDSNFKSFVTGKLTLRMIYGDGTVDFACFPGQVVVTVYFRDQPNARAEKDVQNFLAAF